MRKSAPIQFSMWRQRQTVELHERRWQHVRRKMTTQEISEIAGLGPHIHCWDKIRDQELVPGRICIAADAARRYRRITVEHRDDFLRLNAMTHHLDLIIDAPHKSDLTIGQKTS